MTLRRIQRNLPSSQGLVAFACAAVRSLTKVCGTGQHGNRPELGSGTSRGSFGNGRNHQGRHPSDLHPGEACA